MTRSIAAVTIAEAVGRAVAALGCRQAFGVVGSGNFVVTRALVESGAGFVAARHETAAVTMADAWARVTGEVGVATVHQGPGFTNALTGLAEAAKSRTPLVVLAGDTSAAAVRSNFRVDQAAMAAAVGAVPERVHTPATAVADVTRAFRRAALERRTVALMLPLDVQAATDGAASAAPPAEAAPVTRTRPAPESVAAAADLLAGARRPAIVAGRGAVLAGARRPLEDLADLTGALLATSALGHGLFAGNPYALGISGGFASPVAAELLREADLVLAAGASLNMWTTRHGGLVGPSARVVQIDCEVDAIGAHRPVDLGIVGDVAETATELDRRAAGPGARRDRVPLAGHRGPDRRRRLAPPALRGRRHPTAASTRARCRSSSTGSCRRSACWRSTRATSWGGRRCTSTCPTPRASCSRRPSSRSAWAWPAPSAPRSPGPTGWPSPRWATGARSMAAGEIETVGRLGLPMLVVVYNDAAYGAEVHHFGPRGEPLDIVTFPDSRLRRPGAGRRRRWRHRPAGRGPDRRRALDRRAPPRPLVVDAKVEPTVVAEWLSEAFRAH